MQTAFAFCILHFALLHYHEYGASLDQGAFLYANLGHGANLRRSQLVFHLHRFDDHESLPLLNAVTRLHEYFDDFARHWCDDPVRPRRVPGVPRPGAAATRTQARRAESTDTGIACPSTWTIIAPSSPSTKPTS